MNYMTKQGRQIMKYSSSLAYDVLGKWEESLPQNFQLNWKDV
jgi:hypothetical protein